MSLFRKRSHEVEAPAEPRTSSIRSLNATVTLYLVSTSVPDHLLQEFWDGCARLPIDVFVLRQFERDFMAAHSEVAAQ